MCTYALLLALTPLLTHPQSLSLSLSLTRPTPHLSPSVVAIELDVRAGHRNVELDVISHWIVLETNLYGQDLALGCG